MAMARLHPPPFLTKTYQLVDDTAYNDVISWNEDGSGFVVWDSAEFSSVLLPKYFKHNNFSSFVRQLNTYGFRKVMPDRWEFAHDFFKKGEKNLLCEIKRRRIATSNVVVEAKPSATSASPISAEVKVSPSVSGEEQVISVDSSASGREFSGSRPDLIGENERLRKENSQLKKELSQMKSLCNDIYVLMSNFGSHGLNSVENVVKQLDLLPVTGSGEDMEVDGEENGAGEISSIKSAAEEIRTMLFGMPISVKRVRTSEMDLQLQQPGGDVKRETSDMGQGSSHCI